MHIGKTSWGGHTMALAKFNDSSGKKHRNRVSKEERRKMTESFIKRHRASNNGKFPSLNLTHKKVGGSFYTVREIVREIIQENRVLCPGNSDSPSFILNDSSVITIEPSSMERWDDVSSIVSDHSMLNYNKADSAHSSKNILNGDPNVIHDEEQYRGKSLGKLDITQEEIINGVSGNGVLETDLKSNNPEIQQFVESDEVGSVEGLSSLSSLSTADEQQNTDRTSPSSSLGLETELHSSQISENEGQLVVAGTVRKLSNSEQKSSGENPIWIIIKGFFASFVKFWVE